MKQNNHKAASNKAGGTLSRCSFLASAAFAGATALAMGSGALAGCSSESGGKGKDGAAQAGAQSIEDLQGKCEICDADLLVIGGGHAGTQVALEAYRKGERSIMLVDKGPLQFSGDGMN